MKRLATPLVGLTASVLLAASLATSASAALRVPQVPVLGGTLQGYLNSVGEAINVLTDQDATSTWSTTVSGNSTFSLQIELSGNAGTNTLGIYNGSAGAPLYQVFPGAATSGWFATASFRSAPTRLVINLFDQNATLQGTTTYLGGPPDRNNFGYYLQQGGGTTFYTQDARNPGGLPQALAYKGTGVNSGQWWLCWEDTQSGAGSDQDFDDAVLFLESIAPTPVSSTSWGQLKARFH